MTSSKSPRRSSIIERSQYAPGQPPVDERRQRLDSLGQDQAGIARAKQEMAQIARQQSGRASAQVQLDDIKVQERKPRLVIVAPAPLLPPTPTSGVAESSQSVDTNRSLGDQAATDQQSPASQGHSIQKPGVSEQKQAQANGDVSPARPRFERIEHHPVRSAAAGVAYPRGERYAPAGAHAPIHDVYPAWETLKPPASGQPFVLLLSALVCVAVIWMFFQSPKTFISTYDGAAWSDTVSNVANGLLFNQAAESRIPSANVSAGEHSVLGEPSINAAAIDTILSKYGSPAAGTGQAWFKLGQQYGIDPAYAVAFFIHESSAGTNPGWAGIKPDGSTTHNVGNIICAGYPTCYNRFRDYASWDAGIADWYKLISNEYVNGRGAASVEQIIPIYAPSFENDVDTYVQTVVMLVDGWRRQGVLR